MQLLRTGDLPLTGYELWASENSLTGDASDDEDGDGMSNLAEYLFGRDPAVAGDSRQMELVVSGSDIHIVAPVRKDIDAAVNYSYQVTDNLVFGSWSNVSFGAVGTNDSDSVINIITNGTPASDSKMFIRMLIEKD